MSFQKVYHTTAKGNKALIHRNGWKIKKIAPHLSYYGTGIYFWELLDDAHEMGKLWYDNNYDIVEVLIPKNDITVIDRSMTCLDDPVSYTKEIIAREIRFLKIPYAYFSHRRKLIAQGASILFLVNMNDNEIITIPFTGYLPQRLDSIDGDNARIYIENVHNHDIDHDTDWLTSNILRFDSFLDCGCGSGKLLKKLRAKYPESDLFGVEKSKVLVDYIKRCMIDVSLHNIDFLNFNSERKFDAIMFSFFLHHVYDQKQFLYKAINMLSKDGIIYIYDRIGKNEAAKKEFEIYWNSFYKNDHEWEEELPRLYTIFEIEEYVNNIGFSVISVQQAEHDTKKGTHNFPKTLIKIKK